MTSRPEFRPLFKSRHLATIAGNFWPREIDVVRFPPKTVHYRIDGDTTVVAQEHQPKEISRAQLVMLHGLEGSSEAGYFKSLSQCALTQGFGVHRLNLRTCGGTENLCKTMYHSGLTSDTRTVLRRLKDRFHGPLFLVGFSLGGNVALKLAGEGDCESLLDGVCSISAPIDLAACVRAIDKRENFLYARRFLDRLKRRIIRKSALSPSCYSSTELDGIRSIWEFDDHFTAPLFGFGTAQNYYATQSAQNFLGTIEVPGLLITAQDDPLVPFETYQRCYALVSNPNLEFVATRSGGHLGFLSRGSPRFWVDTVILNWVEGLLTSQNESGTSRQQLTSV